MEKQPFTPAGILALQQWLYKLPPLQFNEEILTMNTNFEAWSLAHLELTTAQLTFFNQLSETAKSDLACKIQLGAAYKKLITLIQHQQKSSAPIPEEDKLFEPKSSITVTSHSDGTYDVNGEVEIAVTYIS
ncbi:hypothetical protein [Pedobacter insulae]|uniref:Uncharacterized protein n=1 Tax=Pedobacter insulae TaxID=414048 RepID=A0A1I2Y215_9SPHI|nr:hypothetical protein [Pedobacter insulae]SFH19389.1 hypothetical protein SAMN04489864_106163 [Pedobacter insulae]